MTDETPECRPAVTPPPPAPSFSVEHSGTEATIRVDGEVDSANVGELEALFDTVIREGALRLVLDFHGVTFIDSSGLRVLVTTANRLGEPGGPHLRIVRPSEPVRRVLDATGLTHFFRIEHVAPGPE